MLERTLASLDGRGYAAYKHLRGTHDLGGMDLVVDHVQVDPYAPPSRMRLVVDARDAALPADLVADRLGRIAVSDFLTRRFAAAITEHFSARAGRGPAAHGDRRSHHRRGARPDAQKPPVTIGTPGQEILERSSVLLAPDRVEARIEVALPAAGRRIRGREAAELLLDVLPELGRSALFHGNLDAEARTALAAHVALLRDQDALRTALRAAGLVAFVGDGAVLPRSSGASDLPLTSGAVAFRSPDSLRVSFDLPSGRAVTGMGVPEGITVVVGGGYHGKSTLLRALERGVYPHIAGDGREWVVTRPDAVSIRAEDGRAVTGVDISPFIGNLPSGTDTRHFTTTNASGSTSQAANLMEAVDSGAGALLIDEDTSATNFMIRDERMRLLVPAAKEPITPFHDRIRPLWRDRGVPTVLVAGGSGAFFALADHVIAMDSYVPYDVTQRAHEIAAAAAGGTTAEAPSSPDTAFPATAFPTTQPGRVPDPAGLQPGHKQPRARGLGSIQFGRQDIDVSHLAQLVDPAQTEAIARILDRLAREADGRRTLDELVDRIEAVLDENGLDALSTYRGHPGHLARPRRHEILAAVNRHRGLRLV
ncbi:ABC-ATPase domain-containing protein [Brevibacterium samyangense]|uniref:ABC-ATPase domain-containing protein n=1 Tax=Brevibacterium samyangense TaxID=366888 RepID=A0ABN2T8U6_9MICO